MRRLLLGLGALLLMGTGIWAQEYPKVEIFGGYSYGNFGPTLSGESRANVNGWNASVGVNFSKWFGVVSDFDGHYGSFHASIPIPPLPCTPPNCTIETKGDDKYHNFLFGPQFTLRKERVAPFVQFLIGDRISINREQRHFPFLCRRPFHP